MRGLKAIILISVVSGLSFSYQLIQNAFLNILITHLMSDEWKHKELQKSVVVAILQGGISSVLQIVFAICADAYTGNFVMLASSSIVSVAGLGLTLFSVRKVGHLQLKALYPALLLISLSQAAAAVTLKIFLRDQLIPRDREASEDEEESIKKRINSWMGFASYLAVFAALQTYQVDSLRNLSFILEVVMVFFTTCFFFLAICKSYNYPNPTGSALRDVVPVLCGAFRKRNVEGDPNIEIPPNVPSLRWLDRAAGEEHEHENQPMYTTACSVDQVMRVKFLMKMIPMWSTFIIFCLVYSSGRILFLQEAKSITGKNFPVLLFFVFPKLVEYAVSVTCVKIMKMLGYRLGENTTQRMKLVRIGLGMLFSVFCCIFAWKNASHRLPHLPDQPNLLNYLSLLWLFPQFFFLALMERLSIGGLEQFIYSQVSKPISRYGPPFSEFVIGTGKLLSVIVILRFSRIPGLIENNVKDNDLDWYYLLLADLSTLNFVFYCLVAHWYGEDKFLTGEDREDVDIEMGPITQASESESLSDERQSEEDKVEGNIEICPVSEALESESLSVERQSEEGRVEVDKEICPISEALESESLSDERQSEEDKVEGNIEICPVSEAFESESLSDERQSVEGRVEADKEICPISEALESESLSVERQSEEGRVEADIGMGAISEGLESRSLSDERQFQEVRFGDDENENMIITQHARSVLQRRESFSHMPVRKIRKRPKQSISTPY